MPKKFFIIACEPSADLHGALLVEELKKQSPGSEFHGLGGPRMKAEGVSLIYDMTTISALGLSDVVRQYPLYKRIFDQGLEEVRKFKPDALIVLDSPAFNLRFLKKISAMRIGGPAANSGGQIPTFYYISPQIWAWGGRRIHDIKKTVSKMLVILPFEKEMYDKAGVPCEFVGHPLLDELHVSAPKPELRRKFGIPENTIAVGILPGSRKKEVERILPSLLKTCELLSKSVPACVFYLSKSSNVPESTYAEILKTCGVEIRSFSDNFQDRVAALDFAFVTSGTATLQTALLGTPFFLVYKASWLTYRLGKMLVRVPFLGLVNLLAEKRIVPEFIQNLHPETMAHEAKVLFENEALMSQMKLEFQEVRGILGSGGASSRAAEIILKDI